MIPPTRSLNWRRGGLHSLFHSRNTDLMRLSCGHLEERSLKSADNLEGCQVWNQALCVTDLATAFVMGVLGYTDKYTYHDTRVAKDLAGKKQFGVLRINHELEVYLRLTP
ncbi:hypothetical protein IV203_014107 [Nitzschia inconspicua]|uniref:Uncharacterized protein n=1 Tax=Nitzschia inconspicua TaxID=303405 RepID=A0A9K3Q7Y5_9STRA|nr:hypothetical protein IV203_014295 [Nitzschia inconspicua]KAG7375012.1 hypothetical protein IV203_014107 [Nitzschia inconspicua]